MTPPVRRDLPTYRELIYRPCALWPRSAGPLGEAPGAVAAIPAEAQRGLSAGQDTQEQARPCQRGVQAAAEGQGGEIARQAVQDHGHERDEDLPWQWCAPVRLSGLYHLVSDLPFFGLSRCLLRAVMPAAWRARRNWSPAAWSDALTSWISLATLRLRSWHPGRMQWHWGNIGSAAAGLAER